MAFPPRLFSSTSFSFPSNFQKLKFKNFNGTHMALIILFLYNPHQCSHISSSIAKTIFPTMTFSSSAKDPISVTTKIGSKNSFGPAGEIHVIIGPMFAGKTTALLRRVNLESNDGRNVVMIKSSKDTRYAVDAVVTHDGTKFPCWSLPDLSSFKQRFGVDAYEKVDVIGIDEAQFFGDLYEFCCNAADLDGKTLIVAGLDGDYLRKNFGSVLDIIPLADTVTKLTARCEMCNKRAFFTFRKTSETETELIGGADMYMPVCRQHYVNGQSVSESAKRVLESHKVPSDLIVESALVAP